MDMGTLRAATGGIGMIIRDLAPGDRDDVREALVDCAAFSAAEVRMALDMVESGLNGDYVLPAVEMDGRVRASGGSVFGRSLHMIDHENIHRACGRLEFEAELFLECRTDRCSAGGVRRFA